VTLFIRKTRNSKDPSGCQIESLKTYQRDRENGKDQLGSSAWCSGGASQTLNSRVAIYFFPVNICMGGHTAKSHRQEDGQFLRKEVNKEEEKGRSSGIYGE